jgi:nucleoside-diphosphate-sugar epimerase
VKVLVTGASGNGGQAVCRALLQAGFTVRMADVAPPSAEDLKGNEFIRCDTRTPADARRAVEGMDAVVHLAAWHCAHNPPVSDDTIFAVNVDGTFHILEACRQQGIKSIVYASSMAYGWWSVYGVTKVIGEDLCRAYQEMTGASIAMLRYHEFIPRPYLEFGERLLRNGVDRRDVAAATAASVKAALEQRFGLFKTIVHTNHGMPEEVTHHFHKLGPDWCEQQVPGSRQLLAKYNISLPEKVEQHDLSEANRVLGWKPDVGFTDFLRDLKFRDERGIDVTDIWVPSELPSDV